MDLQLTTTSARQLEDVTERMASLVAGLSNGVVLFNAPHTTVALFVSEFDEGLRDDFLKIADGLLQNLRPFAHFRNNNPNTEAHVMSAMLGTSVMLPVEGGQLKLGTYQRILFFELDGPKTRTIFATHVPSRAD